jgi:hypothetical protein
MEQADNDNAGEQVAFCAWPSLHYPDKTFDQN